MSTDTETFAAFDAADYLATADDATAYLEAIIDESDDDPTVIAAALGAIARSRNFSQIARQAGVSRVGLYKARSAEGNPSLATVINVAHTLGLRIHFEAIA
jgi:probable addiction module antidote protein